MSEGTSEAFSAFAEQMAEEDLMEDEDSGEEQTWQQSLDEFLSPRTSLWRRQALLNDLIGANAEIRESVQEAVKERKIDPILTPYVKKLREGTKTVANQITTDILPQIAERAPKSRSDLPSLLPKILERTSEVASNIAKKSIQQLQEDLQDPTRIPERIRNQTKDIENEVLNVFRETPEGLVTPPYKLMAKAKGYEIREYSAFTAAAVSMTKDVDETFRFDDLASTSNAFNALASYIFGGNSAQKNMDMTTPVAITSAGEMWFYLYNKDMPLSTDFPSPQTSDPIQIKQIKPIRLAVARFTGFVTEGEVSRQKDALLAALAADGIELDVDHGALVPHVILQYNPPYTIPVLRRNEIGVPVRIQSEGDNSLEKEWQQSIAAPDDDLSDADAEDVSPSDY